MQYYIKWLGHPDSRNEWVLAQDVDKELIEDFQITQGLSATLTTPTSTLTTPITSTPTTPMSSNR